MKRFWAVILCISLVFSIAPAFSAAPDSTAEENMVLLEKSVGTDHVLCKVSIPQNKQGKLVIALYGPDRTLLALKSKDATSGENEIRIEYRQDATQGQLMLWDMGQMVPLLEAVVFDLENTPTPTPEIIRTPSPPPGFTPSPTPEITPSPLPDTPHKLTAKCALASSEQNNEEGFYPPENIIDGIKEGKTAEGSYESRWTASTYNVPAWVTVDYGAVKNLSQVDIWWNTTAGKTGRYSGYEIYVSDNNLDYTKVVDKTSNTTPYHTTDLLPEGTSGRFVKISITKLKTGWPVIFEVETLGMETGETTDKSQLQTAVSFCGDVRKGAGVPGVWTGRVSSCISGCKGNQPRQCSNAAGY